MHEWIKKHEFVLWALASVVLVVALFVRGIFYSEPDDAIMLAQFAGAYGGGYESWGVPYVSVFLSTPVALFAQASGIFTSWAILELALYCFAFILFHLAMCKREVGVLPHLLTLFFEWYMPHAFSYTPIALMLGAAGCAVLAGTPELSRTEKVLGAAGVALGILLRMQAGVVGVAVVLPLLFLLDERHFERARMLALVVLISVAVFRIGNALYFASTPELSSYNSWNETSTQIRDAKLDISDEDLASVGWSQNDYQMIRSWAFNDLDTFSVAAMEQLVEREGSLATFTLDPEEIIAQYTQQYVEHKLYSVGASILGCVLLLLALVDSRRKCFALLGLVITYIGIILTLAIRQRMVGRLTLPIFCVSTLSMFMAADTRKFRLTDAFRWLIAFVLAGVFTPTALMPYRYDNSWLREIFFTPEINGVNDTIMSHPDDLFIYLPSRVVVLCEMMQIDEYAPEYFLYNICDAGNWDSFTPLRREQLLAFEGVNPDELFHSMVDNEHVYLVEDPIEPNFGETQLNCLQLWAKEHIGESVELVAVELEGGNGGMYVYQLRSAG